VKHAGRHYALKTLHKAQIMEMGLQARPAPAVGAPALRSAARGAPRHAAASAVHGRLGLRGLRGVRVGRARQQMVGKCAGCKDSAAHGGHGAAADVWVSRRRRAEAGPSRRDRRVAGWRATPTLPLIVSKGARRG